MSLEDDARRIVKTKPITREDVLGLMGSPKVVSDIRMDPAPALTGRDARRLAAMAAARFGMEGGA